MPTFTNNTLLGSLGTQLRMEQYIKESLNPVEGSSIYEQFLYKMDIKKEDPKTGMKWTTTFTTSKPQGPGGFANFNNDMWKSQSQPGYLGLMLPNEQEYIVATAFQYAAIGRSKHDSINDNQGFYEAIKSAEFGPHIREQQLETVKSEIFKQGVKTYIGGVADETAITATDVLTWNDLDTLADSVSTYEVQLIDNRKRVAEDFVNTVSSIISTKSGAAALAEPNVVDMAAFNAAQAAFENSPLRTYRWYTPRFSITGIASDNYASTNVDISNMKITAPDMKSLFSKSNTNNGNPLLVLVSENGYRQLFKDADFLNLIEVSGYKYDSGMSARFDKHILSQKSIMVQGMLIINMGQDYIQGSIASEGIDFGKAGSGAEGNGPIKLDAALIATPGYNFITSSSDFPLSITMKTFDDISPSDRMGFQEFMYMLFTWDVQILTPSSFQLLIHAGRN